DLDALSGMRSGATERGEAGRERGETERERDTERAAAGVAEAGMRELQSGVLGSHAKRASLTAMNGEKAGDIRSLVLDLQQDDKSYVLAKIEGGTEKAYPEKDDKEKAEAEEERGAAGARGTATTKGEECCVIPWHVLEARGGTSTTPGARAGETERRADPSTSRTAASGLELRIPLEKNKLMQAPQIALNDLDRLGQSEFQLELQSFYGQEARAGTGRR